MSDRETHTGLVRGRAIRLWHQVSISRRESEQYASVGAHHAAKYWAKRANRLAYRLSLLEGRS